MSTLLEIRNLYGGYEEGVDILQGIDMSVAQGEAVGIIGLNGSGKSTLGKAVMNLIPYRRGTIVFDGEDVSSLTTYDLAQKGMAMMHQGGVVFPNLSVWENLSMAFGPKTDRTYYEKLEAIIPLLKQPRKKLMHTHADTLSGGQRHELALAMTLARHPRLVILDEPSAGLSPAAVEEMYGMLGEIQKEFENSILLIEQNINQTAEFCQRCLIIKQGSVANIMVASSAIEIERFVFESDRR